MTLATIIQQAPAIWGGLGTVGGIATAVPLSKWWEHQRAKRAQTDEVALSLVDQLRQRIDVMDQRHTAEMAVVRQEQAHEREICSQRLEAQGLKNDRDLGEASHKIANLATCVEMLLIGYDLPDDKRDAHVSRVRERLQAA